MIRYAVRVTIACESQITRYGLYFAKHRRVPETARRWVNRIYDKIETLEISPQRCPLAPEDVFRDYDVRYLLIGDYVALFTIDESARTVHVIGFRHGHRRPLTDLPEQAP
jgi:toxin ParE1/3/4